MGMSLYSVTIILILYPRFLVCVGAMLAVCFGTELKVHECWLCLVFKLGFIRICPAVRSKVMSVSVLCWK